ncbi:MAG: YybS family protein [Thermodesulfobacteriota bacterium]
MPQTVFNGISRDIISGVAISSLIVFVSSRLPVLGALGLLSLPLPIFYYRAKLGRKNGLIMLAAVIGVISLIIGGASPDLIFVAGLLMTGFVLCELVERQMSIEQTLMLTGGLVFFAGVFGLIVYSNMAGAHPWALLTAYIGENLAFSLKLYKDVGMPAEQVQIISQSLETIQYYLVRILPSLCGAFLLLVAWITFLGARTVLIKRGMGFPDFGRLNTWQAPEPLVWGVIASGGLLLLSYSPARLIALNALILLMTIYFFQGIAIVSYWFEKKHLPAAMRFFIYSLIALWHVLLVFIVGLGFFDVWADFRRLKQPETGDTNLDE